MNRSKECGEVVLALLMGAMMVGALVLWLGYGSHHGMPMHGGGGNHVKSDNTLSGHHDAARDTSEHDAEGRAVPGTDRIHGQDSSGGTKE